MPSTLERNRTQKGRFERFRYASLLCLDPGSGRKIQKPSNTKNGIIQPAILFLAWIPSLQNTRGNGQTNKTTRVIGKRVCIGWSNETKPVQAFTRYHPDASQPPTPRAPVSGATTERCRAHRAECCGLQSECAPCCAHRPEVDPLWRQGLEGERADSPSPSKDAVPAVRRRSSDPRILFSRDLAAEEPPVSAEILDSSSSRKRQRRGSVEDVTLFRDLGISNLHTPTKDTYV